MPFLGDDRVMETQVYKQEIMIEVTVTPGSGGLENNRRMRLGKGGI